jgi:hypothetical protein
LSSSSSSLEKPTKKSSRKIVNLSKRLKNLGKPIIEIDEDEESLHPTSVAEPEYESDVSA